MVQNNTSKLEQLNVNKLDFSLLPMDSTNSFIRWKDSVGYTIPFEIDGNKGCFEIVGYKKERKCVQIKYDNRIEWFDPKVLRACTEGVIHFYYNGYKFTYNIGDIVITKNKNITILKCKRKCRNTKNSALNPFYYVKCNLCGKEYWISEQALKNGGKCSCQLQRAKTGIDDFATMHPELLKYFVDTSIAYLVKEFSNKYTWCRCPKCGFIKYMKIGDLTKHGFHCDICDNVNGSYPERFMKAVLNNLGVSYKTQLTHTTFEWCKGYLYDFYLYDTNSIIETHGIQHYGRTFETIGGRTLEEEQENDKNKYELAIKNDISNYIIIDSRISSLDWMKEQILKSQLPKLLNFTEDDIDWVNCAKQASNNNILKEVCDYWNEHSKYEYVSTNIISKIFNITNTMASNYLKKGAEAGICTYDPQKAFHDSKTQYRIDNELVKKIADVWNNNDINTTQLGKKFGLSQSVTVRYLKRGMALGLCVYDGKKELIKSVKDPQRFRGQKTVNVYSEDFKYLYSFESAEETGRVMTNKHGVKFLASKISCVCRQQRKHHRHYVFRYDNDDELKYLDINKNITIPNIK